MKRRAAIIALTGIMLTTGCGQENSTFTDEQLDNARQIAQEFHAADRQIEETRYYEQVMPLWESRPGGPPLTLDESLAACDDMRTSLDSAYLVKQAEPDDPKAYLAATGTLYSNMCELS